MSTETGRARIVLALRKAGVTDSLVLNAIETIPREVFMSAGFEGRAWEDAALPIECGQTISQPSIVGLMTQALDVQPRDKVLEVGTGSGYQAAILSQLAREDRLAIVESFSVEAPKTRLLSQKLKGMGLDSVLVITDEMDENLFLSSRNLHQVLVLEVNEADPVSLVRFPKVLVTKGALAKMEEAWQ